MTLNPFTEDDIIDSEYPASQESLLIESNGFLINGYIEIAQGVGPHTTIIILHGIPGTEKNGDLAKLFRRAGFNVVVFHYRGSWGSQGSYSFKHCVEDAENVISFLQKNASQFRINTGKIILIGHSLGGFIALYTAYRVSSIKRVACISGFQLHLMRDAFHRSPENKTIITDLFNSSTNPLGGISPVQLLNEALEIDQWEFTKFHEILSTKVLFFLSALKDVYCPLELYDSIIIKSLEKLHAKNLTLVQFAEAGHSYSDHRIKMAESLLTWLNKDL